MNEKDINSLKRNAKKIKKQTGCTHSEALNQIAKQVGYANWSILMKNENGALS